MHVNTSKKLLSDCRIDCRIGRYGKYSKQSSERECAECQANQHYNLEDDASIHPCYIGELLICSLQLLSEVSLFHIAVNLVLYDVHTL